MKKLMSIISMLLLALTATTLVSCDDDSDIAATHNDIRNTQKNMRRRRQ